MSDHGGYFVRTRVPALFGAGLHRMWPLSSREHALSDGRTLCGLPSWLIGGPPRPIVVMRHPFRPDRDDSCRRCGELVRAMPTTPGSYERLHDALLADAEPGAERDGLLDALRRGVRFEERMGGQAHQVVRQHGQLDRLLAGRDAAERLADTRVGVDLIRLTDGGRAYLMLRPQVGSPLILPMRPAPSTDR